METNKRSRESFEARIDELDRHIDQIARRPTAASAGAETPMRPQLSDLRARLAEIRARLREKEEVADRASDAALVEVDCEINDIYTELVNLSK